MVHLLPTKNQRRKEIEALITDLSLSIAKSNDEGKWWTVATYLRLKEAVAADLKKLE